MVLSSNNIGQKKYGRIISLVASQTELFYDLGLETEVVGITKFCIHPQKWFRQKVRIGGTKNVNFEKINALAPDLIIANKEENVKEQVEQLAEKYDVYISAVNNLEDALLMINDVGNLTNQSKNASDLYVKISEGFEKLEAISSRERKTSAAYFIWKDPWMVAASQTFINDMMKYAGLKNVFSTLERYPIISMDGLQQQNPETILLSTEPYPFKEKHQTEMKRLFPGKSIRIVDGEMFSWYGSRLLKYVEYFYSFLTNDK
jgi:ABC-type Fe3+-hydroxamate transport system substrate-binding protein